MEIPIVGRGASRDLASIPLATRDGWQIPNERHDAAPAHLAKIRVEQHMRGHPSLQLRSRSTSYNCVGMVFASRRTCVEPECVPEILRRDGYRRITIALARRGDIVLYRTPDGEVQHVGLLLERTPDLSTGATQVGVLSQWGFGGEFIHDLRDVPPLFGDPTEAWTDRIAA